VSTHFSIDLAHPGNVQRSRWDWFIGAQGRRHLMTVAGGGVALILLVGLGGVLPRYLRYSNELASIAALNRDVATATNEATTLRASLRELAAEARRQVRWSELLPTLSQRLPESLKIDRVSLSKGPRAGATAPADQSKPGGPELALQIDASTAMVAGGARLEEIANFIASLATEPTVARRFQVKTWEVKSSSRTGEGLQQVSISLAEKRP
jgi:hypothetical protein